MAALAIAIIGVSILIFLICIFCGPCYDEEDEEAYLTALRDIPEDRDPQDDLQEIEGSQQPDPNADAGKESLEQHKESHM